MNGIEKITARIETDTKAEVAEILREGEAKAAQIRAGYEAKAQQEAKAAAAAGEQAAQRQFQRLEGAAEMEAKKMILAAKQECLDSAFANAQKQLLSLPEDKYADLLASLAVKAATTGREEILLNQRDHDRVGLQVAAKANAILAKNAAPELPDEMKASKAGNILSKVVTGASALLQGTAMLTLSDETRDMEGGLTLRDGNVEVNCAFETQLRVLRESMAAQVAAVLFA